MVQADAEGLTAPAKALSDYEQRVRKFEFPIGSVRSRDSKGEHAAKESDVPKERQTERNGPGIGIRKACTRQSGANC